VSIRILRIHDHAVQNDQYWRLRERRGEREEIEGGEEG